MTESSKPLLYGFRFLSAVAIWLGLAALFQLAQVFGALFDDSVSSEFAIFMSLWFSLFLGPFAYFSIRYGFRGLLETDPVVVKSVVGVYAVFLTMFVLIGTYSAWGHDGDRPLFLEIGANWTCQLVLALVLYWFTYRFLLRRFGEPCPPMHASLPRWPLIILAWSLFFNLSKATTRLGEHFGEESWDLGFLAFILAIGLPITLYNLAADRLASRSRFQPKYSPARLVGELALCVLMLCFFAFYLFNPPSIEDKWGQSYLILAFIISLVFAWAFYRIARARMFTSEPGSTQP
jgi:hypothetical protein